jgi:hypothetical protein
MIRNGSVYASTARFDSQARALTEDELRAMAPSVFAVTAHDSRSERFRPIPTIEVVRGLAKEGFAVVGARQAIARQAGRADFTKHLLRIRRLDDQKKYTVGDSVMEMLLKNANDGTSAYDLLAGMFRVRCLNSLVAQTSTIDTVKVRHSGDVMGKVIEGTYRVVQEADKLLAAPADWSAVTLRPEHRNAFAAAAHVLRFADAEGNVTTPIQPAALLEPRRREDDRRDLWTTFNVVQENVIKGGLTGRGTNAAGQRRRTTTRAIKGIDQDVRLNKALWVLAEELKKAA